MQNVVNFADLKNINSFSVYVNVHVYSLYREKKDPLPPWTHKATNKQFRVRNSHCAGLRTAFAEVAAKPGPRISLLWGKLDTVVPFSHADEAVKLGPPGRIKLLPLEKLGHEAIFEDAASVCRAMESVLLQRSKL